MGKKKAVRSLLVSFHLYIFCGVRLKNGSVYLFSRTNHGITMADAPGEYICGNLSHVSEEFGHWEGGIMCVCS